MMGANYTITTRADGTVLTAAMYNADHQNHIDNAVPLKLDDYSANTTQMRTMTDPGEQGSESLAGSLAGELERLRFTIYEMKTILGGAAPAQWYTTIAQGLTLTRHSATNFTLKFPNGLIVQGGYTFTATTTTSTPGNQQVITFNYNSAFPTEVLALYGTPSMTGLGSSGNEDIEHVAGFGSLSTSQGQCRIMRWFGSGGSGEAFGFRWLAIGR